MSIGGRSRRIQVLVWLVDQLVISIAIVLGITLRTSYTLSMESVFRSFDDFTAATAFVFLVYSTSLFVFDLYNVESRTSIPRLLLMVLFVVVSSALILAVLYYFFPNWRFGRGTLIYQSVVLLIGLASWRVIVAKSVGARIPIRKLALVGTGPHALQYLQELSSRAAADGFVLSAVFDSRPEVVGRTFGGVEVQPVDQLRQAVREKSIGTLLLGDEEGLDHHALRLALGFKVDGLEVDWITSTYERVLGKVPLRLIGESYFLHGPSFVSGRGHLFHRLWRLFDIGCAVVGLVLCLPFFIIIPLLILVFNGRPILFRQTRVGKNETVFSLAKFRTMVRDAERLTGAVWASRNDPRVTRLGRFLRRTRLDEIPQFWNVLRGDMSIIGPRPERPEFVEQLKERIPYYALRFCVAPGLTGWAQVNYGYGSSENDALVKLQYELYYIRHVSLFLNALILLKTIQTILIKPGS